MKHSANLSPLPWCALQEILVLLPHLCFSAGLVMDPMMGAHMFFNCFSIVEGQSANYKHLII